MVRKSTDSLSISTSLRSIFFLIKILVRIPVPGPISKTFCEGDKDSTILSAILMSFKKCCPSAFFGFTNRKIFYLITENPVYGCNALGMLIPSSVWKFSIIVARTLGNARELPFNV